ncbi:hypothetical protein XENTR_v10001639 [Xenopus tropicalis]|nr:hypothetical protein XENTR_v10001639 [Xenopus tropicalis]
MIRIKRGVMQLIDHMAKPKYPTATIKSSRTILLSCIGPPMAELPSTADRRLSFLFSTLQATQDFFNSLKFRVSLMKQLISLSCIAF